MKEQSKAPGILLSAIDTEGKGVCKFKCKYCFAAEQNYSPKLRISSSNLIEVLEESSNDYNVLIVSCDTELFQNTELALQTLKQLARLKKDITFPTKMILGPKVLKELSVIQEKLRQNGNLLSVMVSIPMFDKSSEIEVGTPSPQRRANFLKNLKENDLFPYVAIRPLLPPNLVTNEEIGRIVDMTIQNSYGYALGPYWFREDVFGLLNDKSLSLLEQSISWMGNDSQWYIYRDQVREYSLRNLIESKGGKIYDSTPALMSDIKAK